METGPRIKWKKRAGGQRRKWIRSNSGARHRNADFKHSKEIISTQGYVIIAHGSSRVCLRILNVFHILRRLTFSYALAFRPWSFEASLTSSENMTHPCKGWGYSGTWNRSKLIREGKKPQNWIVKLPSPGEKLMHTTILRRLVAAG